MRVPKSSRRTFLKTTITGATVAMGQLKGLAVAAGGRSSPQRPPTGAPAESQDIASPPATPAEYTRGIGVYPGNPAEDFAPILVADDSNNYRNLALLRPAFIPAVTTTT